MGDLKDLKCLKFLLCCFLAGLLMCSFGIAKAQSWPDEDGFYNDYAGTDTYLSIHFAPNHTADLNLSLYPENPELIEVEPLQQGLQEIFNCELAAVALNTDEPYYWSLSATCQSDRVTQPTWGKQRMLLNFAPLIKNLKAQNFETLDLTLVPPALGNLQVTPPPDEDLGSQPWVPPNYYTYLITLASPDLIQISFTGGYHAADIWLRIGGLGLTLGIPVGLLFWRRQRALACEDIDKAPIWFGFQRSLASLIPLMWMAWLVGFIATDVRTWLPLLLGSRASWAQGIEPLCFFLPPVVALLVLYSLSHKVFKQIGQWNYSLGELLLQVVITHLALLLPLLCFVFGFQALASGQMQRMGVLLLGAIASRLIFGPLAQKLRDMTPHAITTGELRDRIFALAQPAGVSLNQVYVLPMRRSRMLNAFAVSGGNVMLTDYLIKHLNKAEVDAVMAHEIAHLHYGHIQKKVTALVLLSVVALVILLFTFIFLMSGWRWWLAVPIVCFLGLSLALMYGLSRRFEYQADAKAARLTGNAQAMISGLGKLARLNQMPLQWGFWGEIWMTHPSIRRRINALGHRYDISATELDTLVSTADQQGDYYSISDPASEASPIFSSQVKQRIVQRLLWAQLLCVTLLPAGLARGIVALPTFGFTIGLQWLGYLAGGAITAVALRHVMDAGPLWGFKALQRQMAERLQQKGLAPDQGVFVSLATDADCRIYEGFTHWDIGYLFVGSYRDHRSGQLVYIGEQTQFALAPQNITALYLSPWGLGWANAPKLCITWQSEGSAGTFNLQLAQVSTLTEAKLAIRQLKQRLEIWQANPSAEAALPEPLTQIEAPHIGEVTSTPLAKLVTPKRFMHYWLTVLLLGLASSALMGLLSTGTGAVFYVLGCITVGAIAQFIPLWRNARRSNPAPSCKI
ncbi:MAG: M48 family metalloprotease [Cyanobacteria bacterium P01_A01_bin.114]